MTYKDCLLSDSATDYSNNNLGHPYHGLGFIFSNDSRCGKRTDTSWQLETWVKSSIISNRTSRPRGLRCNL
jgi:hypothetical protein